MEYDRGDSFPFVLSQMEFHFVQHQKGNRDERGVEEAPFDTILQ